MFQRTKHYDVKEAHSLIDIIPEKGFIMQFPEVLYCLHDLAKTKEKKTFQEVVDFILDYHVNKNPDIPKDHVRHEVLARLEGMCIEADMGKVVIGFPIIPPEKPGKTQNLFLELYGKEYTNGIGKYFSLKSELKL